jgi:hypothetical protein
MWWTSDKLFLLVAAEEGSYYVDASPTAGPLITLLPSYIYMYIHAYYRSYCAVV